MKKMCGVLLIMLRKKRIRRKNSSEERKALNPKFWVITPLQKKRKERRGKRKLLNGAVKHVEGKENKNLQDLRTGLPERVDLLRFLRKNRMILQKFLGKKKKNPGRKTPPREKIRIKMLLYQKTLLRKKQKGTMLLLSLSVKGVGVPESVRLNQVMTEAVRIRINLPRKKLLLENK